jgi:hypothetical protein
MIDYVTTDDGADEKKLIRYQFTSSEVFSSENQGLIDYLFDEDADANNEVVRSGLLPRLMSFLDADSLNPTCAGYFNKTVVPIVRKRGYDFWSWLAS